MTHRGALLAGAIVGGTGVAAGAFGAHALRPILAQRAMVEVWDTAVRFQLFHAASLVGIAAWMRPETATRAKDRASLAAACWIGGTALFSGSLYLLALGGPRWLGPITPLGGLTYLVGWTAAALAALASAP